ncbi:hypothetical protein P6166_00320 [Stenotrophomonas sp. HITSZ_GD]|uniref:hypothetical protein n=1 Tax=Stenotrophomonas sp. HITSZ_GD TaxID=3037248 RepID=UPI00240DE0A4|nr:hypothetical protein [Stenotrophomonas sp. HITSZ_GD]MDG2523804.1 hypothetical protein [Stenotrophomonas sp. HITSZ_GD]
MTEDDVPPILLNGQIADEPVRLRHGDTVVLVNTSVSGKIVVGPLRILGRNGYHAAHIATEPRGAMPEGAPENWFFTHGAFLVCEVLASAVVAPRNGAECSRKIKGLSDRRP